jgi:polyhydroxyalkanoate synthesis regulator phasin
MKKQLLGTLLVCSMAVCFGIRAVQAGEIDILLDKLVEKGVLSGAEAKQVKIETKEEMKKEIAAAKSETLPKWIQTMKLKGDFRARYQMTHAQQANDATNNRQRARIRLRAGLEAKVNEKLLVAFGLATGLNEYTASNKDNIRSTNQSLGNSFAKKPFNLDYAYAKYMAVPGVTLFGGKLLLNDVLWEPGDLIWDTDITPEGLAVDLVKKIQNGPELFFKSGVYFLEEISASNDDPYMLHVQPGLNVKFTDAISLKSGVALDYFAVKNFTLDGSSNTNTGSSGTFARPTANFFTIAPAAELKINEPLKALGISFLNIPTLKLFGEYVNNIADVVPDDNKQGFMLGLGFGADKVAAWGDWQFSYNFARLEKDAVLDILPDSDRYEGGTGIRAHEWKLTYGLGKNTSLDFDIYRSQRLIKPAAPETLVQVDWNMKF